MSVGSLPIAIIIIIIIIIAAAAIATTNPIAQRFLSQLLQHFMQLSESFMIASIGEHKLSENNTADNNTQELLNVVTKLIFDVASLVCIPIQGDCQCSSTRGVLS
jgi:hypothetical protein